MKDFENKEFHPTEMYNLINKLIPLNYSYMVKNLYDTPQVIFFSDDTYSTRIGDAVCHSGTYGHQDGLIEVLFEDDEDVIGWLTADEVIEHLRAVCEKEQL